MFYLREGECSNYFLLWLNHYRCKLIIVLYVIIFIFGVLFSCSVYVVDEYKVVKDQ